MKRAYFVAVAVLPSVTGDLAGAGTVKMAMAWTDIVTRAMLLKEKVEERLMHILQQPHRCQKCGFECPYGPHDHHPAPVLRTGEPVCPRCWEKFITDNCGVMDSLTFPKKPQT